VPAEQALKVIDVLESWLVRRMLVRATTSNYNQVAAEVVTQLRKGDRTSAGDVVEAYFADQNTASRYWPDDDEVAAEIAGLVAYKRLRRGRLRMVLEAIEDHRRGWKGTAVGLGGERVARNAYHIEHLLPQSWEDHWPLGSDSPEERNQLLHTFGNLTLLTSKLNSKVSHGPWPAKEAALKEHDVLKINADLLNSAGGEWDEARIRARTSELTTSILQIWPAPAGHVSGFGAAESRSTSKVTVADLIGAGLIEVGTTLFSPSGYGAASATVLSDGRLDLNGSQYDTPSGAAKVVAGTNRNGWRFFRLGLDTTRSLSDLFREYVDQTSADVDDAAIADGSDDSDDDIEE
jgi:hypothetical protein